MHPLKVYIIVLLVLLKPVFALSQYNDYRGDSIDIQKIALHIVPDLTAKTIKGEATIAFRPKVNNVTSMRFDLLRMQIVALVSQPQGCTYTYNDSQIYVLYATPLKKDSSYTLTIKYQGSPMQDPSAWGGWYWSGNYVFNLGVGFNSVPHNLGRAWFPCIDNFKVKQAFEITISCPNNLKAVSNGVLMQRTDTGGYSTYRYDLPQRIPCYLASLNIGPYTFLSDTLKSIDGRILQIRIASDPKDSAAVLTTFFKLKPTVQLFEKYFGPYPFAVVGYSLIPFGSGAMEHAANIGLPLGMANGTFNYETTWAHELSHMWWGDNITCANAEEMWINEGWASYCERLFTEHFYGKAAYQKSIDDNHRYCLQFAHLIDQGYWSLDSVPQAYTYGTHSYQKGCDMVHTLRKLQANDSIFSINCKRLHQQHQYSAVTTDTVLRYFASGECEFNGLKELFKNPRYLSNKLESHTSKGNGLVDAKLATYNLKNPSNTCLPIEFTCDGDTSFTSTMFTSVHQNGSYQVKGNASSVVMFDASNKFSDANTSEIIPINQTGTFNLDNEICAVSITQKFDKGFLYVNRSWDYTGGETMVKGIQTNSRGFWRIDGYNIDKLTGSVRFQYNGAALSTRAGFEAVDYGFITKSEDSLVLLYRDSYFAPWQLYPQAVKAAGSTTDKKGSFLVNEIKKGQYCIGQYNWQANGLNNSAVDVEVLLYPNPAREKIMVSLPENLRNAEVMVVNAKGQLLFNQHTNDEKIEINTSSFAKGIYFLRIMNGTAIKTTKFIIE